MMDAVKYLTRQTYGIAAGVNERLYAIVKRFITDESGHTLYHITVMQQCQMGR